MSANKYGSTLTVILVIAIVVVIGGGGFLFYNYVIKPYNNDKETAQAISEFETKEIKRMLIWTKL